MSANWSRLPRAVSDLNSGALLGAFLGQRFKSGYGFSLKSSKQNRF
jgi:hypothetical protein